MDFRSKSSVISLVKLACRQELDLFEWSKWNYKEIDFEIPLTFDTVPRIDCHTVPHSEFVAQFEQEPGLPVILLGATRDWNARHWTIKNLQERFGNEKFKVGETNRGKTVYMSMNEYVVYLSTDALKDDSPLYIFDSLFADRRHRNSADKMWREKILEELLDESENPDQVESFRKAKKRQRMERQDPVSRSKDPLCAMLLDYHPPSYFALDLFAYGGESSRPPYRWVVIGPKRAGTYLHTDPLGTSAWNALLSGKKRWALFPPGTPRALIDPKGLPDREAVTWFARVYPTLNKNKTKMVEIIQHPGETVFVPGGWAHVVMNLDLSIAITQNFCSAAGLERCFLKARTSRPKFTQKWVKRMPEKWRNKLDVLSQVPRLAIGSSSSSPSSSSSSSDTESDSTA